MQSRGSKYLRRRFRALRRSLGRAGTRGIGHSRNYLLGRTDHLRNVQKRVILWTVLVFVLIGATAIQIVANRASFTHAASTTGGTYVEGTVGAIETLNPILASTNSELSASRLLFTGLFDYDETGALRPALATRIATTDAKTYTVTLRQGVTWSDGKPFTSADVVYTIGLIQNEAVRSPLALGFTNVTVSAPDSRTVRMVLPAAYAPFPNSLTFGILPRHALASTAAADIRGSSFNLNPVTLGAFGFTSYRAQDAGGNPVVYMSANQKYFRSTATVDRFQLHGYKDQAALLRAYERREVGAIAGTSEANAVAARQNRSDTTVADVPIDNADYAFFNTKSDLYGDGALRAAIRQGTDLTALLKKVGGGVQSLNGPILAAEVPDVAALTQDTGKADAAKAALDTLGWRTGTNGIRSKDGTPLVMRLATIDSPGYRKVAEELAAQWHALGVDVRLTFQSSDSAGEQLLIPRAYDVLIYELPLGADPDVYAYWHSSQNTGFGRNFSGYSSGVADDNLASSRTILDSRLRDTKYVAFVRQWLADTPAVALFQQSYHYVSGDDIVAMRGSGTLVTPTDRYADVTGWTVDTRSVMRTP